MIANLVSWVVAVIAFVFFAAFWVLGCIVSIGWLVGLFVVTATTSGFRFAKSRTLKKG